MLREKNRPSGKNCEDSAVHSVLGSRDPEEASESHLFLARLRPDASMLEACFAPWVP